MVAKNRVKLGGVYSAVDVGRFQSGQYAEPDKGKPKLPLDWQRLHVPSMRVAVSELELSVAEDAPPEKLLEVICRGVELLLLAAEEKDAKLRAEKKEKEARVFSETAMYCAWCHGVSTQNTTGCAFCGSTDGKEPQHAAAEQAGGDMPEAGEGVVEVLPVVEADSSSAALPAGPHGAVEVLPAESAGVDGVSGADEYKASLARLRMLQQSTQMSLYDIGVELRRMQDKELWKAGGFPDFRTFMVQASGMSQGFGYKLIQVAREFSREDFERHGITKLRVLASLEDGAVREELLEAARNGATAQTLTELRKEKTQREASERERAEKPSAPAVEPTVALLGRVGAKAKTTGFRTASEDTVEHGEVDGAYVAVPVVEGVELHIALVVKGGKVVKLSHRFVSAEE